MKNIYAHTVSTYPYPAYISINQRGDSIEISVRTDDNAGLGYIHLTQEQCEQLAKSILAHISGSAEHAPQPTVNAQLLEALKRIMSGVSNMERDEKYEQARAAIAQLEGKV